jgi:hypothetical protein
MWIGPRSGSPSAAWQETINCPRHRSFIRSIPCKLSPKLGPLHELLWTIRQFQFAWNHAAHRTVGT